MYPVEFRAEYLRGVAARSAALSRFSSLQRELLKLLAVDCGRVALLTVRDAALVAINEYRELEEDHQERVDEGVYEPLSPLEALVSCRRKLAAAVGARLADLLEKRVPQAYPEKRRLYFGGSGQLIPPPEQ